MPQSSAKRGKLLVVSGPSGVGKSTIDKQVVMRTSTQYSVSATTRQPRDGEIGGVDYHFVTRERFEQMIANDELLEWADVFGNYYGTPIGPVDQAIADGKVVLLEIDIQGGLQVAKVRPDATFVLVVPPSEEELTRRLTDRGSEDADSLAKRLGKAHWELKTARESDVYTREVVNDTLEAAIEDMIRIVEE